MSLSLESFLGLANSRLQILEFSCLDRHLLLPGNHATARQSRMRQGVNLLGHTGWAVAVPFRVIA